MKVLFKIENNTFNIMRKNKEKDKRKIQIQLIQQNKINSIKSI